MKKSFIVAALAAVVFGMSAVNMQAQTSTSTSGGAGSEAGINSGNGQTGGFSSGGSGGSYSAGGKKFSLGGAGSSTKVKSTFELGPGTAESISKGMTKSNSFALGSPKLTNTTIGGSANQGTYAGLSTDPVNGVSAGNNTGGQYQASGNGQSELKGIVHDTGETKVTAVEGPNNASTTLKTFGASDAKVTGFQAPEGDDCHRTPSTPQMSVNVAGNGGGNAQNYLSSGSGYAGATIGSTMDYSATGNKNASGALGSIGNTGSTLTPTTATSTSQITSFSAAHGH